MRIKDAIDLIKFAPADDSVQTWADLGCGDGVFTKALASLLPAGSVIYAVDLDEGVLKKVPDSYDGVSIEKLSKDFTSNEIAFHEINGIIMANALHYVKEKEPFVIRLAGSLKANGRFLLIEYDINSSNYWVPYPLPMALAEKTFLSCGFSSFVVLEKRRSVFGNRWMYAALAEK